MAYNLAPHLLNISLHISSLSLFRMTNSLQTDATFNYTLHSFKHNLHTTYFSLLEKLITIFYNLDKPQSDSFVKFILNMTTRVIRW